MTLKRRLHPAAIVLTLIPAAALAQSAALPDAPGTASVTGVVVDASGAAVAHARIILLRPDGTALPAVEATARGEFHVMNLPAGTYRLSILAPGFAPYLSEPIALKDGAEQAIPQTVVTVASNESQIDVQANDPVIAEAQMKQEERQRFLAIVPNFYISYEHDPVPLTTKQKYRLALRDTFDPIGFVGAAAGAGVEQLSHRFPGYGYGWAGYGKRYAALYGDGLTGDLFSHAVYPALFHQDPRYLYQGTGSKRSRLRHALAFAIITRGDDGRPAPNYSYLAGHLTAGALSNLYYPHADRGASLVFINAGLGLVGQAGVAVAQEFLLRHFTTNVPKGN